MLRLIYPSKVTTPQDAHKRLVLLVYLGSNTSEFSGRSGRFRGAKSFDNAVISLYAMTWLHVVLASFPDPGSTKFAQPCK